MFYPSHLAPLVLAGAFLVSWLLPCPAGAEQPMSVMPKAEVLMSLAQPRVEQKLAAKGFQLGQPIFIRIFKMSGTLEVWIQKNNRFQHFTSYHICNYSGYPGPKLYEGDWQSPEGFYTVNAEQLNPQSRYHLSFNIGYPNDFDIAKNRTGSAIMVHGNCSSQGCYAMGNKQIEEIYLLAHYALAYGQERFSIHIFPFKLTDHRLAKYQSSPWYEFWKNMQPGFTAFEQSRQVPLITSVNGRYVVNPPQRLAMGKRQ